jgi:hypothetical protein
VTVIGPHIPFSNLARRDKVHRIGGADEEVVELKSSKRSFYAAEPR